MNHSCDQKCQCSIVDDKNISLEILCIHKILVHIEESFMDASNFQTILGIYQDLSLNHITFYVNVQAQHVSQLKSSGFIAKCNLNRLCHALMWTFDFEKFISISIEMLSVKKYVKILSYNNNSKFNFPCNFQKKNHYKYCSIKILIFQ